ncbi:MAG: hypothetical protein QM692_09495 [Thermomicrobiales bacterium]
MDGHVFDALVSAFGGSRRRVFGVALAAAGAAAVHADTAGKKKHRKKKKRCKAPSTKCGRKLCCQPGEVCAGGQCQTAFTAVQCSLFSNASVAGAQRVGVAFVASGTGGIGSATFQLSNIMANTPFGVEIRMTQNGIPTTTVLAATTVTGLPVTPPLTYITATATFAQQAAVSAGATYALLITDLDDKGFEISKGVVEMCPGTLLIDLDANNQFLSYPDSTLVFSVSP